MSSKKAWSIAVQGFRSKRYPPPSRVFIPPNTPSTTPRNRYTSGSHPSFPSNPASAKSHPREGGNRFKMFS